MVINMMANLSPLAINYNIYIYIYYIIIVFIIYLTINFLYPRKNKKAIIINKIENNKKAIIINKIKKNKNNKEIYTSKEKHKVLRKSVKRKKNEEYLDRKTDIHKPSLKHSYKYIQDDHVKETSIHRQKRKEAAKASKKIKRSLQK